MKKESLFFVFMLLLDKKHQIAALADTLDKAGALDYTVIVSANASDPAPMQFYAPLVGASVGEYFRDTGRSALIFLIYLSRPLHIERFYCY